MKKFPIIAFVIVFTATLAITGIDGSFAAEKKEKQLTKVMVGCSPLAVVLPVFAAKEKGWFEEEGIDVDIKMFQNSTRDILPLIANNTLDAGKGGLNAGYFNGILQGLKMKLVGSEGTNFNAFSILISKKLYSGTIEGLTAEHIKGQTFAIPMKGYPQEITIERFLNKYGLTWADVNMVTMSWANMFAGLSNGTLFGAAQAEPFRTMAIKNNDVLEMEKAQTLTPDQQGGALFFSENFCKNEKAATAFMVGFIKGTRYTKDWENGNGNDTEVFAILQKYTAIKDISEVKGLDLGLKDPDAGLNVKGIMEDLKWYKEKGYIPAIPAQDEIVDLRFVKAALKKTGKYKTGENK